MTRSRSSCATTAARATATGGLRVCTGRGSPVILSDVLPQLQHMGVRGGRRASVRLWCRLRPVLDLRVWACAPRPPPGGSGPPARPAGSSFEQTLCGAVAERDRGMTAFNALVLDAGLTWREVVVLRAYARYLRQGRDPVSARATFQRVLALEQHSDPAAGPACSPLGFDSRPRGRPSGAQRGDRGGDFRGELDEVVEPRPRPEFLRLLPGG